MLRTLLLRACLALSLGAGVLLAPGPAVAQDELKGVKRKPGVSKIDRSAAKKGVKRDLRAVGVKRKPMAAPEGAVKERGQARAAAKDAAREAAKDEARKASAAAAAAAKATADAKATAAESQRHARHMGIIERLEQIASATANEELSRRVVRLRAKEAKRRALVTGGGA